MAMYLISTHKKGISSHQLARDIEVTQKTAWFILQKIRTLFSQDDSTALVGDVECDEAYIGGREQNKHEWKKTKGTQGRSTKTKTPVFGMVQRGGKVVTMEDSAFVLHCGNEFKKKTIEARFLSYIRDALRDLFSADFEIKILNDEQLSAYHGVAPDYPGDLNDSGAFTFETYVVGPSNKLAYAAAHAVSERPGVNYNPLFIYGDSGLGKTHLLYAIAHGLKKNHPDAKIVYIKGDDFTNELVASIREGKNAEFREKYRQATLLLVDDVQFIAILLIAIFFHNFKDNVYVERFFRGVRPAVVALIAAPCFKMARTANITWTSSWIPVVSCLLIAALGVSPIWIILAAGVGGYVYGRVSS